MLLLQVHQAPRVLKMNSWISKNTFPSASIIAGCKRSLSAVKLHLYPILEAAHRAWMPHNISTKQYVDDLAVRDDNDEKKPEEFSSACLDLFIALESKQLLHNPDKTVCNATHPPHLERVASVLRDGGFKIKKNRTFEIPWNW